MNFGAYIFAPATLVTPLGALSVVFSAVVAAIFLRERMNIFAQLGCALCLLGTTLTVIFAPKETQLERMWDLVLKCIDPCMSSAIPR